MQIPYECRLPIGEIGMVAGFAEYAKSGFGDSIKRQKHQISQYLPDFAEGISFVLTHCPKLSLGQTASTKERAGVEGSLKTIRLILMLDNLDTIVTRQPPYRRYQIWMIPQN